MEPIKCEVQEIETTQPNDPIPLPPEEIRLPLSNEKLQALQAEDKFCKEISSKLQQEQLQSRNPYYIENGILKRFVEDGKQKFEVVVLPQALSNAALQLVHEGLGHNGSPRTYALLKRYYYWKGLKPMVRKHVQACKFCQEHNKQAVKYSKYIFEAEPAPMKFISMDLIGEFNPPSSKENRYALTVMCMFTGYTFCIPIPNKKAETILKASMDHVYCKYGGSFKILSDNGTEFKNKLKEEISKELGVEYKVYSPAYRPQINGRIESFHYFLKACITTHINHWLEWDDVVPLPCAAYNFLPNEHSRETLKNIYQLVVTNLKLVQEKRQPNVYLDPKLKEGDLVLVKDHTAKAFQPRFKGNHKAISQKGNQVEIRLAKGGETVKFHVTNIKKIMPVYRAISQLPDKLGRLNKLRLNPKNIPDLDWQLASGLNTNSTLYCTAKIDNQTVSMVQTTPTMVTEVMMRMTKLKVS